MRKYLKIMTIFLMIISIIGCSGSIKLTKEDWIKLTDSVFEDITVTICITGGCIPIELKNDVIPIMEQAQLTLANGEGILSLGELLKYLTRITNLYTKEDNPKLSIILNTGMTTLSVLLSAIGEDKDILKGKDYENAITIIDSALAGLKASEKATDFYHCWCD